VVRTELKIVPIEISDPSESRSLRAAALAAIWPSVRFAPVIALIFPVRFGLDWLFDHSATLDWKLGFQISGTMALVWYFGTFLCIVFDLRKQAKIEATANPAFPAVSFLSGLYGLTILGAVGLSIGLWREGDSVWMYAITLGFALLAAYAWPRTIHCDESAVWQRNRWGVKKTIPYKEIETISTSGVGRTTILGATCWIEHTDQYIESERFRDIVSRRSGKKIYY